MIRASGGVQAPPVAYATPLHERLILGKMHNTIWKNPTSDTVTVNLFLERGRPREKIVFKPGEEVQVRAEFDSAIRYERNGVVMGGHAPQLVKVGEAPIPVHSSIVEAAAMAANAASMLESERMRAAKVEAENAELKAKLAALEEKMTAPAAVAPPRGK